MIMDMDPRLAREALDLALVMDGCTCLLYVVRECFMVQIVAPRTCAMLPHNHLWLDRLT